MDKKEKNIIEEVNSRKAKKVPFAYNILGFIGKNFVYKKHRIKVTRKIDHRKIKGAYFVVGNHTSRIDYVYSAIAMLPVRLHFISAYNEFFRSHIAGILKTMSVIPKCSYYSDTRMIKEAGRALNMGGRVIIFPEGESSMSGANQPVLPGTGKLFKHFKVPVLSVKIKGGYLTNPKFSLFDRPGRVDVELDSLFTVEDLQNMTADEIQRKLNEFLKHDDYEWNKKERVKFKLRGRGAENMHHLLYWCPKCKSEHTMIGQGNIIKCTKCNNGATLNEYYDLVPLDDTCVIPETPRVWFDMQRELVKEQIAAQDFVMTEKVKLGMLSPTKLLKDMKTSEPVGSGEISISHDGFWYRGTRNGENFEFNIKPQNQMSMAYFTDMTFFALYHNGEMFEFTPEQPHTLKFRLAVEEMHRAHGGNWNW